MIVNLKNNQTNQVKQVKLGFSWTTLFFGLFPALFRADWLNALIMFLVAMVTCGLSWLVFPFFYNTMYAKTLFRKGFVPATEQDRDMLMSKGIAVPDVVNKK